MRGQPVPEAPVWAAAVPDVAVQGQAGSDLPARSRARQADPDRAAVFQLQRERTAALIVESLIIFIPCLLWFLYYNRQLSVCGSSISATATQCSAVVTRFLTSLAGLIVSGLLTLGATGALAALVARNRR